MSDIEFSDDDLRVMALLEAFYSLSEDTENAGTIKLFGPTGTQVGELQVSSREISVLVEAIGSAGNMLRLWDPRTGGLPEADPDTISDLLAEAEALVNGEQQ